MNKARRAKLNLIEKELARLAEEIEDAGNEEREAFDNLPESLQQSERGEAMDSSADELQHDANLAITWLHQHKGLVIWLATCCAPPVLQHFCLCTVSDADNLGLA